MTECMMAGQMRLTDPIDTRNVFDGFSRSDCPKKLPERVICPTDLPRSPDGKILKAELRQQLVTAP